MDHIRALAIADRAASPTLKLIAAVNVLFLISFLIVLTLAVGKARAEISVRSGAAIPAALENKDPALPGRIGSESARLTEPFRKAGYTVSAGV